MDLLDKILGKKQKGIQVFNIPEKKYCFDQKKLSKIEKKDLIDVIADMQKYISQLIEKLQLGKKEFQKCQQRCDEEVEKSNVINREMSRISNQHEQLQVKLTNLQNSLQEMIQDNQNTLKSQIKYIDEHGLTKQKIKDLNKVFDIYQLQIIKNDKLTQNNKHLNKKLEDLEQDYHNLSQKYNQLKTAPVLKIEQNQEISNQVQEGDGQLVKKAIMSEVQNLKSVLEGKQQIILSLNRQLESEKYKFKENSSKYDELNLHYDKLQQKIGEKEEQITKMNNSNNQLNKQIQSLKRNQSKWKQTEDRLKQQLTNQQNSTISLQKQSTALREKLAMLQQNYKKSQAENIKLTNENQKKYMELENMKQKMILYEEELVNLTKCNSDSFNKDNIIAELKVQVQKQRGKFDEQVKILAKVQEEYQVKLKKMEALVNQERIKMEGLKRNLTILENKDEESRRDLDSMYENKIQQDGKIAQMQKKLKQYKHLIQYLKKQKIQLEKTFETKIKNMEEMVNDFDELNQVNSTPQKQNTSHSPSPRVQFIDNSEKQLIMAQKKIAELEEQVDMLQEENYSLRLEKDQLFQEKAELQENFKSLSQKREEAIRQIKKMSCIQSTTTIKTQQSLPPSKPKKQQSPNIKTNEQFRLKQKKIAQKAYKGFDILAKLLSSLYKAFITVHIMDINRKEIKEIQTTINQIVRKSLDMKDIFQDYL